MTINTVLIANRGEIAVRIIRACHQLGMHAIAVYSDADRDAPFVKLADAAFHIGKSEAHESYLNIDLIIDVAKRANADAVHPGYGFLAENAEFARACAQAGLTFVGPSPDVIAQMGSKIAAKAAAEKADVPVVPGYHNDDQSDGTLGAQAKIVGLPLLIKASAGGGGRGMRRVYDLGDFSNELSLARKEAEAAFGDGAVLLERFIENSRHIEVQILADKHGTVLHLFERDCSIQRNHQKIIEEAPAPNLPGPVRHAMLAQAVKLAQTIGYDSAGTVEFIYEPLSEEFYFLEMNTRLQVEHPVTELITGIDLVEWQLRVAGGDVLPFTQGDIQCQGWAMEARVAAEDASDNFRPQTGVIRAYHEPINDNLRIDSGVGQGSLVSHYYDSMLAKVIVKGRDRISAIRGLTRALRGYQITGVGTNTAFLCDVLAMDNFVGGDHHTGLLGTQWPQGWATAPTSDRQRAEAAIAMLLATQGDNRDPSPWGSLGAWRITERAGRIGTATFHLNEAGADPSTATARVSGRDGSFGVTLNDKTALDVTNANLRDGCLDYEEDGRRRSVTVEIDNQQVSLHSASGPVVFGVQMGEQALLGNTSSVMGDGNTVCAPMPGLVAEIRINLGDTVAAGQTLVVLEAMKLLQDLATPTAGTIASIHHSVGDTVDGGAVLVTIDPID